MAPPQITSSDTEERELRSRAARSTPPFRVVQRAKIVLLAAEGHANAEIARRLDTDEVLVGRWRRSFADEGLAGLDERPRPGRPRSSSPRRDRGGQSARLRAAGRVRPPAVALVAR
jgi:hypothetical protein